MKKIIHFCAFLIFFLLNSNVFAQIQPSDYDFWKPRSFTFELSADGKQGLSKADPGFAINEIRWRNTLEFENIVSLVSLVKVVRDPQYKWYNFEKRRVKLAQLFLQASSTSKVFDRDLIINFQGGKLEYYPRYTDPELIKENLDRYLNPPNFYGGILTVNYILWQRWNVSMYYSGYYGYFDDTKKANGSLTNAYLHARPEFVKDAGVNIIAGRSEGSRYAVSEAYAYYSPLIGKTVRLDFRAGKLAGIDKYPYGGRIGAEIYLKYIAIGGYYERRFNQPSDERFFGIYWRIIGPPELASIFGDYQLIYDTSTNTIRFNIPFLTVKFF